MLDRSYAEKDGTSHCFLDKNCWISCRCPNRGRLSGCGNSNAGALDIRSRSVLMRPMRASWTSPTCLFGCPATPASAPDPMRIQPRRVTGPTELDNGKVRSLIGAERLPLMFLGSASFVGIQRRAGRKFLHQVGVNETVLGLHKYPKLIPLVTKLDLMVAKKS